MGQPCDLPGPDYSENSWGAASSQAKAIATSAPAHDSDFPLLYDNRVYQIDGDHHSGAPESQVVMDSLRPFGQLREPSVASVQGGADSPKGLNSGASEVLLVYFLPIPYVYHWHGCTASKSYVYTYLK